MKISVEQVIKKAANTPKTVAAALGDDQLRAMFAEVLSLELTGFCLDSRKAFDGCGFVLLASAGSDKAASSVRAAQFAKSVADKASFIISEFADDQIKLDVGVPVVYLPTIRQVLGDLIAAFLQIKQPVALPTVVAVTGTNGKTTVSQLIAQLGELSGVPSAIMGTAGNGRLGALTAAANTTGDVLMVQQFIHQMACEGVRLVALEASSHGLDQYRLQGVPVAAAAYTNLSHDHLDYHRDMQEYRAAKAKLFDRAVFPTLQAGVVNADAEYALMDYAAADLPIIRTSQTLAADWQATQITPTLSGVQIAMNTPFGEMTVNSPLLGLFNVDNLMAAMAVFAAIFPEKAANLPTLVPQLQGARGRMQRAASRTGSFIVDYAHTPDALKQVLASLQKHCNGKLIAVFGCGGDRDRTKRPLMTRAGLDYADHVILTADNPRSESVQAILKDMQANLSCDDHYKITIEPDRRAAIELAVKTACDSDIVVIAGKGHETYQEINGVRYDFDDLAVLDEFLTKYNK